MVAIYPIVEGHGEVHAMPILLRRITYELGQRPDVTVLSPHRITRGRMLADNSAELVRAVELGARKIAQTGRGGGVVVLLDSDDDCPAILAPIILNRINRADLRTSVVLANREYEAWFLAAAPSLAHRANVKGAATAPLDPEAIRDAKGYLQRHILEDGFVYRETVDQPALTSAIDLTLARAAPSFDKLCRDVLGMLNI